MVNFPRSVSERQRSAEFIWEWNVSERSNGSGTNSLPANSWCLVTHRLRLVKNLKNCVLNSRWKRSRRAFQRHKQKSVSCHRATQTGVSLHSDDFTHWLTSIHSCLFCPFTKPWTSEETFWLHVAFLHHHFSFYFTRTFLSFHFCLIIRILLSQTRDSHKERTKHAEDGLQGSLFDSNKYWECGFGCVWWWSMETGRGCLGYWVTEEDAVRNEGLRGILQQMEKKMLVG